MDLLLCDVGDYHGMECIPVPVRKATGCDEGDRRNASSQGFVQLLEGSRIQLYLAVCHLVLEQETFQTSMPAICVPSIPQSVSSSRLTP
jgi:hypothetical protein